MEERVVRDHLEIRAQRLSVSCLGPQLRFAV